MKIVNLTTIDLVIVYPKDTADIYIIEGPESLGAKNSIILKPGEEVGLEKEE